MGLTSSRTKGVRKLADGQKPTIRADVSGIIDDLLDSMFGAGATLPTGAALWVGRPFFHTTEKTWYVSDGEGWFPVGATRPLDLSTFGTPASGYAFDNTNGASYVYRSGRRIDIRLRLQRTSGVLTHGAAVFNVASAFLPAGAGAWPLAAVQAGGAGNAQAVAAVLNASGSVAALSPNGSTTVLEVSGFYFIP